FGQCQGEEGAPTQGETDDHGGVEDGPSGGRDGVWFRSTRPSSSWVAHELIVLFVVVCGEMSRIQVVVCGLRGWVCGSSSVIGGVGDGGLGVVSGAVAVGAGAWGQRLAVGAVGVDIHACSVAQAAAAHGVDEHVRRIGGEVVKAGEVGVSCCGGGWGALRAYLT